jgi:hypothetical protein
MLNESPLLNQTSQEEKTISGMNNHVSHMKK